MTRHLSSRDLVRAAVIGCLLCATPVAAVEWTTPEGPAHGFPTLRSTDGTRIADGDFSQWVEGGRLHVKIAYTSRDRIIEEISTFRQRPELIQDEWTLRERVKGKLQREYTIDFTSGTAVAKKLDDNGEMKTWQDTVKVEPGRTFAGFGFSLAIKGLRKRLVAGETVELQAIGFTPKPRAVTVAISYGGRDRVAMSDRQVAGDRFVIHPKIPAVAKLFVKVPDMMVWLTAPPAGFLRFEGTLAEPSEALVRIDGLPGGSSSAAEPVATSGRGETTKATKN